jgi:O-antigen ligase
MAVRTPARAAGRLPWRRFLVGAAFVAGAIVLVEGVARAAAGSASPVAAGTAILGLGLAAAVVYGLARDSSVGVLVWLVAALFAAAYADIPRFDRLAFFALIAGWFIAVVSGRQPLRRFGVTEGLMILYLLICVGSAIAPHELSEVPALSAGSLILLGAFIPFALFVLARQTMANRRAVRSFLWLLVWIGLYLALTMIFQKVGLRALVWPKPILDPNVGINFGRARGPMLNAGTDGFALVACFVAALYLGVQRDERFRRFALLVALISPLALFYSETRVVWLAAGLALVLGMMFAHGFRRWYVAFFVGAAAVIAVNWQKFLSADRSQGGVSSPGEIEGRLNDIATAQWAIPREPVFGWGIARYTELNTLHHQAWGNLDWRLNFGYVGHNTYLSIATELGLLGLGAWVAVIIAIGVIAARAWPLLPRTGLLSQGLVLSFIAVYIGWIITAGVIDMRLFAFVNGLVFVWGGIIAGLADRAREGTLEIEEPPSSSRGPGDLPQAVDQLPHGSALDHLQGEAVDRRAGGR